MKLKKKTLIIGSGIIVALLPIVALIASCKNEQEQSLSQKQVIIEKFDKRQQSKKDEIQEKEENNLTKNKLQSIDKVNSSISPLTSSNEEKKQNVIITPPNFASPITLDTNQIVKNSSLNFDANQNDNTISTDINKKDSKNQESLIKHINDSFYPTQHKQPIQPVNLSEEEIKNRILSTDHLTPNYYSHPDYKLKANYITVLGNSSEPVKLELLTIDGKALENVNWYVRTRYPVNQVYKSETSYDGAIISLKNDGTVFGLEYDGNDRKAEVWAEYQGYLYKVIIRVYSKSETINEIETRAALKAAKEITKDWHHLSHYQKALKAYEWMTQNVKYVESGNLVDDQTAYSGLVLKQTVCTGYAKGYKMLLDEMGISSKLIVGPVRNEYHIWNLVEIDGEWYHVDATWGVRSHRYQNSTIKQKTIYNYFLISDDDFKMQRSYNNPNKDLMGSKYRASKINNFAIDEAGVKKAIHKAFGRNEPRDWFSIHTPWKFDNDQLIEGIMKKETGHEYKQHDGKLEKFYINFKNYRYRLEKPFKENNLKKINLSITSTSNNQSNYIIKIKTNNEVDLGLENIDVTNAFIEKIEKNNEGYLVYLTNFDVVNGENKVKLDVFKIGYQFVIDNTELTFKVLQQPKPTAQFIANSNSSGKLINVDSTMQYRTNIGVWKDISGNEVVFNQIGTIPISVRKKANSSHLASEIQNIEITKARDIDREVKYYNKQIIGVDSGMQYRLINTLDWKDITTTRLSNLSAGTYEVRIKPNQSQLASDIVKVVVN